MSQPEAPRACWKRAFASLPGVPRSLQAGPACRPARPQLLHWGGAAPLTGGVSALCVKPTARECVVKKLGQCSKYREEYSQYCTGMQPGSHGSSRSLVPQAADPRLPTAGA